MIMSNASVDEVNSYVETVGHTLAAFPSHAAPLLPTVSDITHLGIVTEQAGFMLSVYMPYPQHTCTCLHLVTLCPSVFY